MQKCACRYVLKSFMVYIEKPKPFSVSIKIRHLARSNMFNRDGKTSIHLSIVFFFFFVVFLSYAGLQNRSRLFYTTQALFSFPVMFGLLGIFMLRKFAGKFTAQLCRSSNGSNCPKCYPKDLRKYTHTRKTIENSQDKFGICSFAEVSPSCKRI